ncbi:MAG TPA: DUF5615 family PIN-like protein [Bryobacterales bacterium]|nr:DUF5615 family PIN-like protein [Bryobacterales bacterium]
MPKLATMQKLWWKRVWPEVPDGHLLGVAQQESRILLTLDKGIADVRMFPPTAFPGIVLFRPNAMGRGEVLKFVRRHLQDVLQLELKGRLVVVTAGGLRFR